MQLPLPGLADLNFILMVFLILVSHEDSVKSTPGFHVAINHPEGKLIIYTAFYLKIQVEMDKAKSIKPCKKIRA